jgi:hypothetical protein
VLNFDMSEADYAAFQRDRPKGALANKVEVTLGGDGAFTRQGTLDFLDNSIDRASGTIHARATLSNADTTLTPGAFGRVRLAVSGARPALLVPDAAVLTDQGDHAVYVVGKGNMVAQKKVTVGDLRGGLRVITSGLSAQDRVVIDGIPAVKPGAPITLRPARSGSTQSRIEPHETRSFLHRSPALCRGALDLHHHCRAGDHAGAAHRAVSQHRAPTIDITTSFPGANADTIARTVATPLEQAVNGVENMDYITSQSTSDGALTTTVYFKIGSDPNIDLILTRNRVLDAVSRLPPKFRRRA